MAQSGVIKDLKLQNILLCRKNISSRFLRKSEANDSEFLENIEDFSGVMIIIIESWTKDNIDIVNHPYEWS